MAQSTWKTRHLGIKMSIIFISSIKQFALYMYLQWCIEKEKRPTPPPWDLQEVTPVQKSLSQGAFKSPWWLGLSSYPQGLKVTDETKNKRHVPMAHISLELRPNSQRRDDEEKCSWRTLCSTYWIVYYANSYKHCEVPIQRIRKKKSTWCRN